MIAVQRSADAPAALTGPKSAGVKERTKLLAHYASDRTRNSPFRGYAAYRLVSVKKALNALFHNKCAYCEIGYGGAPMDVEHFRPKSAIVDVDLATLKPVTGQQATTPGYYWLAAEWSNLLPSCIDCNRPRAHGFPDGVDEVSGKSNFFPVVAGSARCLDPKADCEAVEQRLLLDPCRDDPQQHIEFGEKGTVRPKQGAAGLDLKGLVSIEVYGLQRDPLVRQREATQTLLRLRIADLSRAAQALAANPNDAAARSDWARVMREIETFYLAPDRPFLGMCRQLVRQALSSRPAAAAAAPGATLAAMTATESDRAVRP